MLVAWFVFLIALVVARPVITLLVSRVEEVVTIGTGGPHFLYKHSTSWPYL
jgi:hypothetical protein